MRIVRTLCFVAVVAALLAPVVRADEWTKQTFFTFSAPVQVPGVTLPAGTYMFKLADPEAGRKAIGIFSEDGTKIHTILLSMADTRMEARSEPWVSFIERPADQPAAIRSWFYPGERTGYEFIYSRSEAMKLASESHTAVLARTDDMTTTADMATMRGAKVERVGDQSVSTASTPAASTTTADASSTTTTSTSSTTTASSTTAPTAGQASPASTRTASSTTATAAPPAATTTATMPTMNEQAATAAPAQTTPAPVGTAGQSNQADQQPARELPRTAGNLAFVQLMSGLALVSAIAVRQRRKRFAEHRA
jgi:hypothetical protein